MSEIFGMKSEALDCDNLEKTYGRPKFLMSEANVEIGSALRGAIRRVELVKEVQGGRPNYSLTVSELFGMQCEVPDRFGV